MRFCVNFPKMIYRSIGTHWTMEKKGFVQKFIDNAKGSLIHIQKFKF